MTLEEAQAECERRYGETGSAGMLPGVYCQVGYFEPGHPEAYHSTGKHNTFEEAFEEASADPNEKRWLNV